MMQEDNHIFQGLRRDNHQIRQDAKFLWDAHNIRLTNREDSTLLSITNERGTSNPIVSLYGYYVGHCVLGKYLVVFTSNDDSTDNYIYRIEKTSKGYNTVVLFHEEDSWEGSWSVGYPIEAIGVYETELIQKVYWVDGKNQPRVINIADTERNYIKTSFDFLRPVSSGAIEVSKEYGVGMFPSGIIQYFFTYYNKHLQQTGIVNNSPILYLDNNGTGVSPEESCSCVFKLSISDIDQTFDYVRIYSVTRTSLDATPTVKRVVDLSISSSSLQYIDTGTSGDTEDPTLLLYIQGQQFICSTIASKDNTLFFGGITLDGAPYIDELVKRHVQENSILSFEEKVIEGGVSSYMDYKGLLYKPMDSISTFKYDEVYRIGVQFKTDTGIFSELIYLGDISNTVKPYVETKNGVDSIHISRLKCELNLPSNFPSVYTSARLVMVSPNSNNRRILCQGIVCPTVFNVGSRIDNSPYAQASWTIRYPSDHYKALPNNTSTNAEIQNIEVSTEDLFKKQSDETSTVAKLYYWYESFNSSSTSYSWVSFRWKIPDKSLEYTYRLEGAYIPQYPERVKQAYDYSVKELQKHIKYADILALPSQSTWMQKTKLSPGEITVSMTETSDEANITKKVNSAFCVDSSIVTLFSPDIPSDSVYKNPNLKFRIIGYFLCDSSSMKSAYNIVSKTPAIEGGALKSSFNELYSAPLWESRTGDNKEFYSFITYMWHGPTLSNSVEETDKIRESVLENKTFMNTRWVTSAHYLSKPWSPKNGTGKIIPFNSNELKVTSISDSQYSSQYYMGNIDTMTTCPYSIAIDSRPGNQRILLENSERTEPVRISYKTTPHNVITFKSSSEGQVILPAISSAYKVPMYEGVPVWFGGNDLIYVKAVVPTIADRDKLQNLKEGDLVAVNGLLGIQLYSGSTWLTKTIPDNSLLYCDSNGIIYRYVEETYIEDVEGTPIELTRSVITSESSLNIDQDVLDTDNVGREVTYIGELYIDVDSDTLYGDHNVPDILKSHMWIPTGKIQKLTSKSITLYGDIGDTYYQRWDCLMSYPYTQESINKVIDITSFMVESRINLDGRYDKKRGNVEDLTITPQNFNILNDIYSQKDNFFNYRILDEDYYKQSVFANQIAWSKEKNAGEEVDPWTNITLANTLDMNGENGKVTSLKTWNEFLLCFQERALSQILFNSRVQIPVTDGVPIEISNSNKVDGSRLFSGDIGCSNKWSITSSPIGVYFLNSDTDSIYLFNGQLENLSTDKGMTWWTKKVHSSNIWNPFGYGPGIYNGVRSFYDSKHGDVYFSPGPIFRGVQLDALCYSERLGQFTSLMSYGGVQAMFNFSDGFFSLKHTDDGDTLLYENNVGEYNNFYGDTKGWGFSFISNDNPTMTKIFDTIELRTDHYSTQGTTELLNTCPVNYISVDNEYQHSGDIVLDNKNMRKKFRIWRGLLPRNGGTRQRIRNPWSMITLGWNPDKTQPNNNTRKAVVHDVSVKYTI